MIKLGSIVTDKVTGIQGMATHLHIEMNGQRFYNFQPRGLHPETGEPVARLWVVEERLVGGEAVPEPDLPLTVLGTEVEDVASGFMGTAINLCLHINGCVHVDVQPKGVLGKTGAPGKAVEFDIRRLKGSAVPVLTDAQLDADKKTRPSPDCVTRFSPRD